MTSAVEVIVRAELEGGPLWTVGGETIDPRSLPLSDRVLVALDDWISFFDDVGGEIGDRDVLDEFVGQGFKISHAIRRELKGSTVWFHRPDLDEQVEIVHRQD